MIFSSTLYSLIRSIMLPLEKIDESLPKKGLILDLGCGQGIITSYLANKKERNVLGIDSNIKRLKKIKQKNLTFKKGDIVKINLPRAEAVIISDVLHHIKPQYQKILLKKISFSVKKDGILVIKEIDKSELVRSSLSRFWDYILYPKDKIYYWKANDLKSFLKKNNFKVNIVRSNRLFPGSTTLFICTKV